MLHSMTGFASVTGNVGGWAISVQLKSVNGRYLDLYLKFPGVAVEFEQKVKELLKSRLHRGRVDLWVELQPLASEPLAINVETLRACKLQLDQLGREFGQPEGVSLASLLQLPGVLSSSRPTPLVEPAFQQGVQALVERALDAFVEMRAREGGTLRLALLGILETIGVHLAKVAEGQDQLRRLYFEKWHKRLGELLAGQVPVDEARLLQEAAYQAERCDIAEEIQRFQSHLEQFRAALQAGSPVGKKLDFIVQEMNREVNTILSKTEVLEISRAGLEIKSDVERLREQVQNIE